MKEDAVALDRDAPGYEAHRRRVVWQRIVPPRHPARIVRVGAVSDISAAVKAARTRGRRVSVSSGGHSYIGHSLQDGVDLLDLSALSSIRIDAASRTATVGPGVRNGVLADALGRVGLAFPIGHSPGVAVGGFLLGGGLGWNPDGWGIAAAARVIGATVVLADGEIVEVSADRHPELFFALRGSGPLFPGVVGQYRLALAPAPARIAQADARVPLAGAGRLGAWAERYLPDKPDSIELAAMFVRTPEGPVIELSAVDFSDDGTDAALSAWQRSLPDSLAAVAPIWTRSMRDLLADNDGPPQRYGVDGVWSDDIAQTMSAAADGISRAVSADSLIHLSLRGRPQLPEEAAFSVGATVFAFCSAVWDHAADDLAQVRWLDETVAELSLTGVGHYVNETDFLRHPERLRASFSPAAWHRLQALRRTIDPEGVFRAFGTDVSV